MKKDYYKRDTTTRNFLLSFFPSEKKYAELEKNGFFLVKQFCNQMWTVAVFSKTAFLKRKKHRDNFSSTFYRKTRGKSESESK